MESLLAQSFRDFEMVLVDDGSIDRSGIICDEYAAKYGNIKVIHQDNGGVTLARRNGIQIATGTWIFFVDSDDTLPEDAISVMAAATNSNVDIVIGCVGEKDLNRYTTLEQCRHNIITGKLIPALWGKLIRRELFLT